MLVEFSVENFRVFREKQTFSMVLPIPSEDAIYHDRTVDTGYKVAPYVSRQACLFGANGAGKTALVDAIFFLSDFVKNSVRNVGANRIAVDSFAYCEKSIRSSSKFDIAFIQGASLYHYGFVISPERVEEEWLFVRPRSTGRSRQLFSRIYDSGVGQYDWVINSAHLKGERGYWRQQTRQDALFLTTAVQFDGGILKEPFIWLTKGLRFLSSEDLVQQSFTARQFNQADKRKEILRSLRRMGIKLADIIVREEDFPASDKKSRTERNRSPNCRFGVESDKARTYSIDFIRLNSQEKPVAMQIQKESRGTQILFALIGPILEVLDNGYTLVADDFSNELHPLALRKLTSMFNDTKINRKNAQLIFTTHDVTVTDATSIGNDGIWLLQKKADQATKVFPFSIFKGQEEGTFSREYLHGVFGAVPVVT